MKLPLILIIFLPKKWQERYMKMVWAKKTDEQILDSFKDATEWIDLSIGIFESETMIEIAESCIERLERYILPQMRKRGLI